MKEPVHGKTWEKYNQDFFDEWAKKYDDFRISRWFQYTQEMSLGQFDWQPDGKLLDVGCGTGYAVLFGASMLPEGKACGIDISQTMVDRATAKITPELKGRVEFQQASAEQIPYEDNHFNFVLCTNSFHHYQKPMNALKEMRRVLKPGGMLVIFENAPDLSLYTWLWDRWLRIAEKGHVRYYPSKELGDMIRNAGFENVEQCLLKNECLKHGKLYASIQIWKGHTPEHY